MIGRMKRTMAWERNTSVPQAPLVSPLIPFMLAQMLPVVQKKKELKKATERQVPSRCKTRLLRTRENI